MSKFKIILKKITDYLYEARKEMDLRREMWRSKACSHDISSDSSSLKSHDNLSMLHRHHSDINSHIYNPNSSTYSSFTDICNNAYGTDLSSSIHPDFREHTSGHEY